ncbi:hypothetical protein NL676_011299 [Syzygium grande]|nr:hypothetical protein NL676_011299 [Syzygium grande]
MAVTGGTAAIGDAGEGPGERRGEAAAAAVARIENYTYSNIKRVNRNRSSTRLGPTDVQAQRLHPPLQTPPAVLHCSLALTIAHSTHYSSLNILSEDPKELGLPPLLLERLEAVGFKVPTDVQAAAIPTILKNHDVVIQSYTGSGKTLAYLLPILSEMPIIVAPSRELGMQIVREFEKLLGPADKKVVQQLVGGANRSRQEEALKKNKPAIVVGTPGRIAEISAAGKLHTHNCRFLVLDEVDELLSFNFREDMHRILEHVGRRSSMDARGPKGPMVRRAERQTILVSATVPVFRYKGRKELGK